MTNRTTQELTLRVEVQQVRSEFLSDPERAVVHAGDRLDIEVGAGQEPSHRNRWIDGYLKPGRIVVGAVVNRAVGDVGRIEQSKWVAERRKRVHGNRSGRSCAVA